VQARDPLPRLTGEALAARGERLVRAAGEVALLQADGNTDLERSANRGDAGDPFPGTKGNTSLTGTTNPHTRSYGNLATGVTLTQISPSGPVMTAKVTVRAATPGERRRRR